MSIPRTLLADLVEHLHAPEITLLIGARQAGKTTLVRMLDDEVARQGRNTVYLSLDSEQDRAHFCSQEKLAARLRLSLGDKAGVAFLDEIQRKENAGLFLKGLYDGAFPHKLVVTGSGSLELKEKIQESLAGRKRLFTVDTLSFAELARARHPATSDQRLADYFSVEMARAEVLLYEYLCFGGYPRVALAATFKEKQALLDEIFTSVVDRDLSAFLKAEKLETFSRLIRLLSCLIGSLLNSQDLATRLGLGAAALSNYLWLAEKLFLIERVPPYFENPRKELSKMPVCYFNDLGLRSYALGSFQPTPQDLGLLFQNFLFLQLRAALRGTAASLRFWRSKDKAEVDFIVVHGREVLPIEVKYGALTRPNLGHGLHAFLRHYAPRRALIINAQLQTTVRVAATDVEFLPWWQVAEHPSLRAKLGLGD